LPRHVSCLPVDGYLLQSADIRVCDRYSREERLSGLDLPELWERQNFLVKSLQMHVVHVEDARVEVSEESRPAVLEVLCDECDSALKLDELDDTIRKEVLLTIGAR
jgi:hypothetical protein